MKSASGKTLCKIIEQWSWVLKQITGSHHIGVIDVKDGINSILSIPIHGNRDLLLGTLKSLMKDAEIAATNLE